MIDGAETGFFFFAADAPLDRGGFLPLELALLAPAHCHQAVLFLLDDIVLGDFFPFLAGGQLRPPAAALRGGPRLCGPRPVVALRFSSAFRRCSESGFAAGLARANRVFRQADVGLLRRGLFRFRFGGRFRRGRQRRQFDGRAAIPFALLAILRLLLLATLFAEFSQFRRTGGTMRNFRDAAFRAARIPRSARNLPVFSIRGVAAHAREAIPRKPAVRRSRIPAIVSTG